MPKNKRRKRHNPYWISALASREEPERMNSTVVHPGNSKKLELDVAPESKDIRCRLVRIGSYVIRPVPQYNNNHHVSVHVNSNAFKFKVPTTNKTCEEIVVTLTMEDIESVVAHFGRCLPIMYIFCTPACGKRLRELLHMKQGDMAYFDPYGQDETQKILTFFIQFVNNESRHFLRNLFSDKYIWKEVDQKVANDILVKSTPPQCYPDYQDNVKRNIRVIVEKKDDNNVQSEADKGNDDNNERIEINVKEEVDEEMDDNNVQDEGDKGKDNNNERMIDIIVKDEVDKGMDNNNERMIDNNVQHEADKGKDNNSERRMDINVPDETGRDQFSIFGEFIASELRNLVPQLQNKAKRKLLDALFQIQDEQETMLSR